MTDSNNLKTMKLNNHAKQDNSIANLQGVLGLCEKKINDECIMMTYTSLTFVVTVVAQE